MIFLGFSTMEAHFHQCDEKKKDHYNEKLSRNNESLSGNDELVASQNKAKLFGLKWASIVSSKAPKQQRQAGDTKLSKTQMVAITEDYFRRGFTNREILVVLEESHNIKLSLRTPVRNMGAHFRLSQNIEKVSHYFWDIKSIFWDTKSLFRVKYVIILRKFLIIIIYRIFFSSHWRKWASILGWLDGQRKL